MKLLLHSDKVIGVDDEDRQFLRSIAATGTNHGRNGFRVFAQKFNLDETHMVRLIELLRFDSAYPSVETDGYQIILTME